MRYQVQAEITVKTSEGLLTLKPGQIVRLAPDKATELLKARKLTPFCYWQEKAVDDCVYPCYQFKGHTVAECHHFKSFWAKRLKVLDEQKKR